VAMLVGCLDCRTQFWKGVGHQRTKVLNSEKVPFHHDLLHIKKLLLKTWIFWDFTMDRQIICTPFF
jgi:hypothetical protein